MALSDLTTSAVKTVMALTFSKHPDLDRKANSSMRQTDMGKLRFRKFEYLAFPFVNDFLIIYLSSRSARQRVLLRTSSHLASQLELSVTSFMNVPLQFREHTRLEESCLTHIHILYLPTYPFFVCWDWITCLDSKKLIEPWKSTSCNSGRKRLLGGRYCME